MEAKPLQHDKAATAAASKDVTGDVPSVTLFKGDRRNVPCHISNRVATAVLAATGAAILLAVVIAGLVLMPEAQATDLDAR